MYYLFNTGGDRLYLKLRSAANRFVCRNFSFFSSLQPIYSGIIDCYEPTEMKRVVKYHTGKNGIRYKRTLMATRGTWLNLTSIKLISRYLLVLRHKEARIEDLFRKDAYATGRLTNSTFFDSKTLVFCCVLKDTNPIAKNISRLYLVAADVS